MASMTVVRRCYPAYQPSGVDWLGAVPLHWEVRRLGAVVEMRLSNVDKHIKDGETPVRLCNYLDVYKNDRITPLMTFMAATASPEQIKRFGLERHDVLITKDSENWKDIGVPSLVAGSVEDLLCGYHLALLRPNGETTGPYLARTLQSQWIAYQFHVRANGVTRYGLTYAGIQSVQIPVPPISEQAAIVRYLDYVDEHIGRYVGTKRRLIGLLEEEKQVIVKQAVMRGLDARVGLKPSSVEWLGDVPEHWEVRRLKTLCSMKSGESIAAESIEGAGEYPVYGGNGLRGYTSSYTHDGAFALIGRQGALCGNIHIACGKFWATEHAVVATLGNGYDIDWFGAILTAMNLNQYSIAAAQPGLAVERVLNLHIPVPPIEEQERIARHIEDATASIEAAITRTHQKVELAQEYRTRLTADVVTGKLDVGEAAAQLPNETDDQDSMEASGLILDNIDDRSDDIGEPREEEPERECEVIS